MPKVKSVEKKIWDIEGFNVAFLQGDRDVRGDRQGLPQYPYVNGARNDWTVSQWKERRFDSNYPGFEVAVFDGDGNQVHGGTKLGTLRDTYSDE